MTPVAGDDDVDIRYAGCIVNRRVPGTVDIMMFALCSLCFRAYGASSGPKNATEEYCRYNDVRLCFT